MVSTSQVVAFHPYSTLNSQAEIREEIHPMLYIYDSVTSLGMQRQRTAKKKMGGMAVVMIVAASILMGCIDLALGSNEAGKIYVGGKVLCQDCTQGWNDWAYNGKPIKDCKVSAVCMDERRRIIHYTSDTTDELGEFQLIIDNIVNGKQIKTELCSVRLVSSPDPGCSIFTNFGKGVSGVKLFREFATVFNDNFIKYSLNPFYFTTPMCDQPDTSSSSSSTTSNQYGNNNNY